MKKMTFISILVLVGIAGAWYLYCGRPLASEHRELNKQILVERKKLAAYGEALARFNNEIDEFRRLKSKSGRPAVPFSGENEIIGL